MSSNKIFPNGFSSWMETHHEIVSYITLKLHYYKNTAEESSIIKVMELSGTGGIYELAEDWTDEFEQDNIDRDWDGDFFDEIEQFCNDKNFNN